MRARGQSEAIGTILLVGIAVIVVGGLLVTGTGVVDDAQRQGPSAAFSTSANGTTLAVTHESGDAVAADEVVAVLTADDGTVRRIRLADFDTPGDGDGRLTSGETFATGYSPPATSFTLRLVHEPSELVIAERALSVTLAGIDLSSTGADVRNDPSLNSDSGSGTTTVVDGGRTVSMTGNTWSSSTARYTVTSDTVVSFSFESDNVCEIHGVGFATGTQSSRIVKVAGDQNWGLNVTTEFGQPSYRAGDPPVQYTLAIGDYYAMRSGLPGNPQPLVFVNDCDDGGPADGRFSNVRVYNASS